MPTSASAVVAKSATPTQRSAQAIARIQEIVARDDAKLLAVAVAEVAGEEAVRNLAFAEAIRDRYDELAVTSRQTARTSRTKAPHKVLIPIVSAGELSYDRDARPDAYDLQRLYGNDQLRDALEDYTLVTLKEMAQVVINRNPGTQPTTKRTKAALIDYIVSCLTGKKLTVS